MMFKRKRLGLTDYKKRLSLLKSGKPRLVIRKSNKNIVIQVIEYSIKGDRVLFGVSSNQLKKLGWNYSKTSLPACYLSGLLLGNKAKSKINEVILDVGLQKSVNGSRIYAALKGFVDSGINVTYNEKVFPKEDRLKGDHISKYSKKDISKDFEQIKSKIGS